MKRPLIKSKELAAIEALFGLKTGYVLDFTNRTFALFFQDYGIDIDRDYPVGSKGVRLVAFLNSAQPSQVAEVLEALVEYRGEHPDDEASPSLIAVKQVIGRLRRAPIGLPEMPQGVEVLSLAYVHELEVKTDQRLAANDFDGAITSARTMLEAVLLELERRLAATPGDHKGDLSRLFKAAAKQLRIDEERADLDDNFKQVVRGLVQIINGLAPIRNKMSDGHPRERKPAPHHARVIVNAAKTVATFLIESYQAQIEKGLLTAAQSRSEVL